MRVRAVAVASDRSNAVGAVELECTPLGLLVAYRGVGAFHDGYAPGALTTGTSVTVPWTGVREAAWEGDRLFLHLDEALTPHHLLLLAAFADPEAEDPRERRRIQRFVRVATLASMLAGGLLTTVTVARLSSGTGAASAVLAGCLAAAVVFVFGTLAGGRFAPDSVGEDAARAAFAVELSAYLPGFAPRAGGDAGAGTTPKQGLPPLPTLLPRTTTAVVITMSAALLAAVLTASQLARTPEPEAREPRPHAAPVEAPRPAPPPPAAAPLAPARPAPAAASAPAAAPTGGTVLLAGTCTCKRADSVLWRDGLPRVTTILIERNQKTKKERPYLELELGVVNNSDAPIPEVSLLVQFYDRDPPPSKKRSPTYDRPLYFEGPLAAGQAIKWHVEARGNDFDVSGAPQGTLDPTGADTAPTGVLAELLEANHRPVRLHGAMMLAYANDPRARDGALALREALREEEAPYIDRLVWAMSDVRTCSIEVGDGSPRPLRACVFNASKEPKTGLALRARALDRAFRHDTPVEAPPTVVAEKVFKLSGTLGPGEGSQAAFGLDTSNPDGVPATAFEIHADREELVF